MNKSQINKDFKVIDGHLYKLSKYKEFKVIDGQLFFKTARMVRLNEGPPVFYKKVINVLRD